MKKKNILVMTNGTYWSGNNYLTWNLYVFVTTSQYGHSLNEVGLIFKAYFTYINNIFDEVTREIAAE